MEGSAARRKGTWLAPLLAALLVGLALLVVAMSGPGLPTRPAQAESGPADSPSRVAATGAATATDVGGAIGENIPQTTAIKASIFGRAHAPQYVRGSDGRVHIEYDLLSTNVLPTPVTLTKVEVRAGDGRRLLVLKGDALEAATRPILGAPTTEVAGSGAVGTVVDVEVAPGEVPKHLTNRITYKFAPGTPDLLEALIGSRKTEGPRLEVPRRSATVIAPPLSGKGWWNGNGCCKPSNPHRLFRLAVDGVRYVKPETFAIDWARVRGDRSLEGDESQNESYFAYGAKIRSATGGRVVSVRENMPDETPGLLPNIPPPQHVKNPADFGGNHVVVRARKGVYAYYAHLQPGSVAVRVGEEIETGQYLGRLGNSGNSSQPHLHFQLSNGPDPLTSDSLPYVIDRYRWAGSSDESNADTGETPVEGTPRDERRTYPMSSSVTDFRR
jgi:hypothetical protein